MAGTGAQCYNLVIEDGALLTIPVGADLTVLEDISIKGTAAGTGVVVEGTLNVGD